MFDEGETSQTIHDYIALSTIDLTDGVFGNFYAYEGSFTTPAND
jgi:hypothetical protein